MQIQTITITDTSGLAPVTVPANPRCDREGACLDIIIETSVHIGVPVSVLLSLRTDGSVHFWQTHVGRDAGHYAHIAREYCMRELPAPTEAQRLTVARWWSGLDRPLGLKGGVGATLLDWAFAGMDKSEVQNKYLEGKQVFTA